MNIDLHSIIKGVIEEDKLIYGVFTSQRAKENIYDKISIKPINLKEKNVVQFEKFSNNKAFHENLDYEDAIENIEKLILEEYKNINIFANDADYQIIVSKKNKLNISKKQPTKNKVTQEHNKKKQYLIEENEPCDFLIHLGVMNHEGLVYAKKYDKFKQINKFLEIVDDALKGKKLEDNLNIIDFGCGKAYLTFALYYYFYKIRNIKANITGLDLKKDVIEFCNKLATELNYENLRFLYGDIQDYEQNQNVDMIVTLHACDTATDAALVKAIKWNAQIILSVPCCQHELFDKIKSENLGPMLKHGLIKERVSSLVTDTLRTLFLEKNGYKTQLVEVISMEHTPKNILIRAVKNNKIDRNANEIYEDFKKFWNLEDLFIEKYYNGQNN